MFYTTLYYQLKIGEWLHNETILPRVTWILQTHLGKRITIL